MRSFVAAVALVAAPALACPVCGLGQEQGQGAYLFMSGIMSALPLLAIGGVVAWVTLRVRAHAKLEAADLARLQAERGAGSPVTRYGHGSR